MTMAMAMPAPLRLPGFRLLFIGRSMSTISDALVPAALAIAIVMATGSAAALATVLTCALIPRVVLMPLGGVLADRFHPRRMAIGADLTRVATQGFVGLELLGGHPLLWHIAAAQVISGAASACALPTLTPLVAGVVPAESRLPANAMMAFTKSTATVIGPAIAGTLIFLAGAGWVFVFDAAAFATSALLLSLIKVARVGTARRQSLRRDFVDGWGEVRSRQWFWISLIGHASCNFASGMVLTLGPLIAIRELGGEAVWVGVLQVGGIGLLIGSLIASRTRLRRPVLIADLALATYAIPPLLFAVRAPALVVALGYGLSLTALGFLSPVWQTALQREVPEERLARVSAYDWLISRSAQPLGFALGPALAGLWGAPVPLIGASVLVLVACLGAAASPAVRALQVPTATPAGTATG